MDSLSDSVDVKASLSNKSEQKLNLHIGCMASSYRRSLLEVDSVYAAEMICYLEQWKGFIEFHCY